MFKAKIKILAIFSDWNGLCGPKIFQKPYGPAWCIVKKKNGDYYHTFIFLGECECLSHVIVLDKEVK